MRADTLKQQLQPAVFNIIDTHVPFYSTHKLWRTLAFRHKMGPTLSAINNYIISELNQTDYDLIWVDKAVFITKHTTQYLRQHAKQLVHFTPDMMFYVNKSNAFIKSMSLYDLLVTTKQKELPFYYECVDPYRVMLVTQGYDPNIHKSEMSFEKKSDTVVFIGLAEPSREEMIQYLIDSAITVKLVGFGWSRFIKRNADNKYLKYLGTAVYGQEYSELIGSSKFALGLLSKRFPELHTTRTFEIPACGTALLTERNNEMEELFNEDEVIYFSSQEELVKRLRFFLENPLALKVLTQKGHKRVSNSGYDYPSIISSILGRIIL
jgi:spore maturation protein CgeB